jgi:hypothetical protein
MAGELSCLLGGKEIESMRVLTIAAGILLVIAGTGILIYQGLTITTLEQQVLELGPLTASTEQARQTIPLPPIAGGIGLATGAALILVAGLRRRNHGDCELTNAGSAK